MIGYILLFTGRWAYQWGLISRSLQYGVFFGRANSFARENAMLKLQKRGRNGASQRPRGRGWEEFRLPAYGVSQKNSDIGQAYFSPLPLPHSPLSP